MHSILSLLAIGSIGNMELLIIGLLVSVLLGVPLIVVLIAVFLVNKRRNAPPPPPPAIKDIPVHQENPQTAIRNDDKRD